MPVAGEAAAAENATPLEPTAPVVPATRSATGPVTPERITTLGAESSDVTAVAPARATELAPADADDEVADLALPDETAPAAEAAESSPAIELAAPAAREGVTSTGTSALGSSTAEPVAPAAESELAPTPAELITTAADVTPPARATQRSAGATASTPAADRTAPSPEADVTEPLASDVTAPNRPEASTTEPHPATDTTAPNRAPNNTPATGTAAASRRAGATPPSQAAGATSPSSEASQPARTGQAATPEPHVEQAATLEPRTEAWAKLIADPGHAPELLALAAVQSIGPRAREWIARSRSDYPTADHAALARLATSQFSRAGSLGSIFGAVAGSYAPVALIGTAAVAHAELVLHVAAAYGLDPAAPERAVDLLVLTRVHPDRETAERAVSAARRPAYDEEDGGLRAAAWRLSRMISGRVGGWGVVRLINRYLPGVSLLAAFLTSRAATDSLAARANAYYRAEASSEPGQP
jgi:hypothetical protein